MKIDDGKGTGRVVAVNSDNKLEVVAIASSPEHFINRIKQQAYSVLFSATPAGADDYFLYIKNTSENDVIVEGFGLWLNATEYIDVSVKVEGTPGNGSDVIPTNLNGGSGNQAVGVFQQGANITNISGNVAYRIYNEASQGTKYHNFEMDIILPKNSAMALSTQTGTTALSGYIDFAYTKDD